MFYLFIRKLDFCFPVWYFIYTQTKKNNKQTY